MKITDPVLILILIMFQHSTWYSLYIVVGINTNYRNKYEYKFYWLTTEHLKGNSGDTPFQKVLIFGPFWGD